MVARREVVLPTSVLTLAEDAALALRTADGEITDSSSTVPLLRTESAASSRIEQIEVGQRHIGRALADLPTGQRSAVEVANNVRALQAAVTSDLAAITADQLHRVHARLLPDKTWAGRSRDVQNWIGGSDYSPRGARHVPPRPERVAALMADLAVFSSRDDVPAVVQAAVAHAQFETVHPYRDGNGRVGRALTHMVLRRRRVTVNGIAPVSIAVLSDMAGYLDGLTAYEQGDLSTWIRWFAGASMIAADATRSLRSQLTGLVEEWRALPVVRDSRVDSSVRATVEQLTSHPVCSASQLAVRVGVSTRAARTALESLVAVGVLNRTTAARNLQVYEAPEVFAAIADVVQAASTAP